MPPRFRTSIGSCSRIPHSCCVTKSSITGVAVRESAAEIETTTGTIVKVFTTGTMVQVFLLAQSVAPESWSSSETGKP